MIAKIINAASAEEEVERFFAQWLKTTPYKDAVYAVGGYVRDQVLNKKSKDLDVVVNKRGGAKLFTHYLHSNFHRETSNPYELGAGYPIWHIVFKQNVEYNGETFETEGAEIDVADTQKEAFPDANSRQRVTEFGTLEEDAVRRDFSVNSLYKNLSNSEFYDVTGISKQDIEKGILRGNPGVSLDKVFADDPLRMLRLCVFYARYGWEIPMSVLKCVRRNAQRIEIISSERITTEFTKAMKVGKLNMVIKLMKATGMLKYVLPEVQALIGVQQPKLFHEEGSVFVHTLKVLENAPATIDGQMAALLHDVGKPKTQEFIGDKIRFQGHDEVGAEIAEAIMRRLKFDLDTIKKVKLMVENHMRPHVLNDSSDKSIRKFIREVGDEMVDAILDLAEADAKGSLPVNNDIPELRERVKKIKESPLPVSKKAILNGNEIMKILDVKPGEIIGQASKFLLEMEDEYAEKGLQLTKEDAEDLLINKFKEQNTYTVVGVKR